MDRKRMKELHEYQDYNGVGKKVKEKSTILQGGRWVGLMTTKID
jgi:hypothetical protein